jgi:hypothetical protein
LGGVWVRSVIGCCRRALQLERAGFERSQCGLHPLGEAAQHLTGVLVRLFARPLGIRERLLLNFGSVSSSQPHNLML